jgi:hypothetical protein
MKHDFYPDGENEYIPDIKLIKIEGNDIERSVWFTWRETEQWLKLSRENEYGDFSWLVVDTDYTDDFDEWLDEELEGYDSLESMFTTGVRDVIPEHYSVEFD